MACSRHLGWWGIKPSHHHTGLGPPDRRGGGWRGWQGGGGALSYLIVGTAERGAPHRRCERPVRDVARARLPVHQALVHFKHSGLLLASREHKRGVYVEVSHEVLARLLAEPAGRTLLRSVGGGATGGLQLRLKR